jgi:hypothetical protein
MFPGGPNSEQIVGNSLTASGTLITVPAGHTLTADLALNASVAVLGSATLTVTVNGTNAAPASGTVIGRLVVSGLLASASSAAQSHEIVVKAPAENAITLAFSLTGAGSGSATVNGWMFT